MPPGTALLLPSPTKAGGTVANSTVIKYTKQVRSHRRDVLTIHTLKSLLISPVPTAFPPETSLSKLISSNFELPVFFFSSSIKNHLNCFSPSTTTVHLHSFGVLASICTCFSPVVSELILSFLTPTAAILFHHCLPLPPLSYPAELASSPVQQAFPVSTEQQGKYSKPFAGNCFPHQPPK